MQFICKQARHSKIKVTHFNPPGGTGAVVVCRNFNSSIKSSTFNPSLNTRHTAFVV